MSCAEKLTELLRPLGIYDWEAGVFQKAELEAVGAALDGCGDLLDLIEREMNLATAEGEGLTMVEDLLPHRPVTDKLERRRSALAALLRIGGDSFTLDAINDTITGCGVPAVVKEVGKEQVSVSFPGVAGEPDNFQELKKLIEDILPAHLGIEYIFWFLTWQELEDNFPNWQSIQGRELSWTRLETFVEYL